MNIKNIAIKNFRLLADVGFAIEHQTTVIVGPNNSGKTSLTEIFRRLMSDKSAAFQLEDFSLSAHDRFWQTFQLLNDATEDEIRNTLPCIEIALTIDYANDAGELGALSNFIVDLDPECTDATIAVKFQVRHGEIDELFSDIVIDAKADELAQKSLFFRSIRSRIQKCFGVIVLAQDPNDPSNQRELDMTALKALVKSEFINAQRGLDDTTHKEINLLGKVLEALFDSAMANSASTIDRGIADSLEVAVEDIQRELDDGFNERLKGLLPAFSLFGYPGLRDPELLTETTLDVQRLLKDNTKIQYAGINGVNLPESYNGLGVRNLIFMLLKLYEFFKNSQAQEKAPGIHFVFVEEPEVHLHPQMQEVFIDKLTSIAEEFSKQFNEGKAWPVQFVVTTHSSHVANRAPFDAIRYFLGSPSGGTDKHRTTRVKDLQVGLSSYSKPDREFLHKYMTLTRCDLLFADKAILIEGTTERLLLPRMMEMVDDLDAENERLSSQYISIVEVGGAYAHVFFPLLDFLEIRTLVVTDIDAVKTGTKDKRVACRVSEGTWTSNATIKSWFGDKDISPNQLTKMPSKDKIRLSRRMAYQIPEKKGACCGRSFEAAFMLANADLFSIDKVPADELERAVWQEAKKVSKKSDFALQFALEEPNWRVPLYIADGLEWLKSKAETTVAPAEARPKRRKLTKKKGKKKTKGRGKSKTND